MIGTEVSINLLGQDVALQFHAAIVEPNSLNMKDKALLLMLHFLPSLDQYVLPAVNEHNLKVLLYVND